MKQQLRQIYEELSNGRLSQLEALEKIRALKLQGAGVLYAVPAWTEGDHEASAAAEYAQHHIVLCDLPAVDAARLESLLPHVDLLIPQSDPQSSIAQRYCDSAFACFERIRTILKGKPQGKVLVQVVVADDLFAGLSGLLKTAALENPQVTGQVILVPPNTSAEELSSRLEDEKRRTPSAQVRYGQSGRQILRWEEVAAAAERPPIAFKDRGVYVITGGLGGLGILFAREILEQTRESRVVLTGRSPLSAAKRALLDDLSTPAGSVSYRQLDLGDREQVAQLIALLKDEYGRLDGILHSAGIVADNFILKKDGTEFRDVLAPKVAGTFHLDQASCDVELDFFVLFSSVVGAMGNVGQADYAAANAFMDRFATHRNRQVAAGQRRGRTRSIDWPLWLAGGMGTDPASRELLQQATGIQPMQTATGMDAFHRALAWPHDQLLVAEGNLAQLRRALRAGGAAEAEDSPVATAPVSVAGNRLAERTEDYLRQECAELLKLPFHAIDPQAALEKYGIDSILAMKLTGQLEKTFGTLSKTLFFEYQTIHELADYFTRSHTARLAALLPEKTDEVIVQPEPAVAAPIKRPQSGRFSRRRDDAARVMTEEPIAIIGLSGRYPEAVDIETYWSNLRDGKDCIVEVPAERWNWREYFTEDRTRSGHHYSKWGGFIPGVDEFDPLFFNISPKEAKQIDPQERLFLQHAWMAIEDAGYTRAGLQLPCVDDLPGQVGVYVGVMYTEYQLFGAEAGARGTRMGVGSSGASVANRVSYALNLHGPSITLDTMCSSSLTAIHFACLDLKLGRTGLAIAGGVNVSIHPNKYLYLSAGQFISSDGACQSFGEGGDGYIPGEGVGVVVLKRLSEAERDGDHIHGIIRGSALNHGGKTNGYTVPNPQAQATVISRALAEARTDARHISYLEAHGTGTKLGDPIEIAALGKAFARHTQDTRFCLIGSAKSNIGHCESAAGIAGLTKVLLQMQHRQVVPSLHSAQLNPHIDFESSPFIVNQTLRLWEQPVIDGRTLPRIAGISSFGAGGANAHMIVEEYPEPASTMTAAGPVVILLSARTPEQLEKKARDLAGFVRARVDSIDLASMAYTLQVGREPMDERLAFVVTAAEEIVEKLDAYLGGRQSIAEVYAGQAKRNREALSLFATEADLQQTIEKWMAGRKFSKLLDLWAKGLDVDWSKLYGGARPRRMSLPTYPFAKERYWVEIPAADPAPAASIAAAVLHPLLHRNTSDLDQQCYSSTFAGEESFLKEVDGRRILPPEAQLEMARVAVENAARISSETSVELRDVVWAQPVVIDGETQVHIALRATDDDRIDFEIYSDGGEQEIVHCQGRAILQFREEVQPVPDPPSTLPAAVRREIVLVRSTPVAPVPAARAKPAAIALHAPTAVVPAAPSARAPVTLINPVHGSGTPVEPPVKLYDDGHGIFSIQIGASSQDANAHLQRALDRVGNDSRVRVLLLGGLEHVAAEQKLYEAIVSFPYPTIAVLGTDVADAGFMAAALCDLMVCNEDAAYGYANATTQEALLFRERFGAARALDFLYGSVASTGRQLRAKGWTCSFVPASRVEAHAQELAANLATKAQDALRLLKQHLTRRMAALVKDLARIETDRVAAAPEDVLVVEVPNFADLRGGHKAAVLVIDDVEYAEAVLEDAQRTIAESTVPVVAAMKSSVEGNGWILASLCDAFVHPGGWLASGASACGVLTMPSRFGNALTVEPDRAQSTAVQLAAAWTKFSGSRSSGPMSAEQAVEAIEPPNEPTAIALQSKVMTATADPDGIVVVKMEDRDAKNMFSDAFVEGLREVFAHIESTPRYKVVILTGYDRYFASGGTKEALLAIQQGKLKFTDARIFELPLTCKLPVIAAVQGHGLGAGWCLGMFADVVLLSEESRYVSPYMNYGFTPGAGATYILPETLGPDLARESLLTAQTYTGRELAERGIRLPILASADVLPAAMAVARQLASIARHRLIAFKRQWTAHVPAFLEETYRFELAMHEQTFVGRSDTLAQIEKLWSAEAAPPLTHAPSESGGVASVLHVSDREGDPLASVTATLRTLLANELQMRESDVDENAQFIDLGLDSIGGVSWIRKINDKYKTSIEATKIYGYPTLAQLSSFVKEEAEQRGTLPVAGAASVSNDPAPVQKIAAPPPRKVGAVHAPETLTSWRHRNSSGFRTSTAASRTAEPIAVIGMAGQFPQAGNVEEFWQNIATGRDCITQVPRQRWDLNAYYQPGDPAAGKTNCRWLGALEEYDRFDPLFFNISPTEAESMDPQQRLFLQACWHGIENAGYDARALSGSKCGVFVGCAISGDYHRVSREHRLSAQGFTGSATSILAARISYFLNLQGPCISIDTACSSSLVALAQACDSLVSGDSDLALAGGVCVVAGPDLHIQTAQAGMLSPEGRCFTFDQRADGFVPGEGVGVVVLKRLSDAQRDQDVIYGVVNGWGVNQDGKTNGITAPNPESQTRLEQYVYDKYQIDPSSIQLIEAHGTGTKLGDPIEVEGLEKAFARYTRNKEYCALGSVKSNIGHTLTAAGIAGVIKLLLALKHKQLPPTINFERLNEHIDLADSPFYINRDLKAWKLDGAAKRQAAISSFGFSGTNAHVVIAESPDPLSCVGARLQHNSTDAKVIVPLSARTAEQLGQKVADLLNFIRREQSVVLADVAYTLQVGREPMDERLGFVVGSLAELDEKLQAYVDGATEIHEFHRGHLRRGKESLSLISQDDDVRETIVDKWIAKKKLAKLLDLWVRGLEIDWHRLYGEVRPRRIALPGYPFAKERYWIAASASHSVPDVTPPAALHPLLHVNTSDFAQQGYRSTFSGNEFFLVDHQVRTDVDTVQKVLPGVAYLEMARAAIEHALHERSDSTMIELRDSVWARPVIVSENKHVHIALMTDDGDRIDYEIYSEDGGEEIVHCQGRAVLSHRAAPPKLEIERLKAQMTQGQLEPAAAYAACARMGLSYGPTFQGVQSIHRGANQVLAQLRLPAAIANTSSEYVLHPSLLDSAVQSAIGLFDDLSGAADEPRLPFAVESLRIVRPCTNDMFAWVRHAGGSHTTDGVVKLDIDLCDGEGNVCVQLRGFSLRALSRPAAGRLFAAPVWQTREISASAVASYAEHHVVLCDLPALEVDVLELAVPRSRCTIVPAQRYGDAALACFERIQSILRSRPHGRVLMQIVAADAQLAGLSALLKTAALENPQFVGQLILVPPGVTAEELGRCLNAEKGIDALVRYEQGARSVLRWQEVSADAETPEIAFKDRGVYLITGGLGSLGLLFAREILGQIGNARVVLTGRSPLTAEKRALLGGLGDRAIYKQLNLGDFELCERLIAAIESEYGRLDGILHCAGMLADDYILKKDAAQFSEVLEPKVAGTLNLDRASQDVELDFFVLFSSVAGAMGNLGQADYATANGFLDQFAAHRNRLVAAKERHGRTRSINWPLWKDGGMAIDPARRELLQQATGMRPMHTAVGLQAFHRALSLPHDQILVGEGDLTRMRRAVLAVAPPPAAVNAERPAAVAIDPSSLAEKTQDYLRAQFSAFLKLAVHNIDPQAQLEKYGMDSILALKLTAQLEVTFGSLPKTLFFEYQTIGDLAGYFIRERAAQLSTLFAAPETVRREVEPVDNVEPALEIQPSRSRRVHRRRIAAPGPAPEADPIAIIGLSGRYPEAIDVDAYWENLRAGKDCIVEVPKERWDWREYFTEDRTQSGRHFSKWGGFIAGVDEFDPLFFNISPKEAKYIDPQERLFLQHAWMAVEDAGYTRATLQAPVANDLPGQVGVYAGLMYTEYQLFGVEASVRGNRLGMAGSAASIANRVSYALDLHGPSMTLDTMCSSSLTAVHIACQDLKQGRTSLAIAGGVNVSIHPNKYLMLSAGQFISGDGACQSFGEGGDGYIPGEGVGVVVLKRLSEAKRDGDHIYGIIRGSALNHGGRTNGYSVPNPQAQASAIGRALAESHTDARHISYIEAHGTGTKLGDPIEIAALDRAFRQYTQDTQFCLIGSAKSNIGHCESAAGVAGLTKVLLQMRHRQIVPSLHSAQLNPHIDFAKSPFIVNQELRPWEAPVLDGRTLPRIAGLSSFGAGGSNAHLIIEEYQAPVQQPAAAGPFAIVLSARTPQQLQQKSRDLLAHLRVHQHSIDLASVAFTLQAGREAMEERLAFVVSSVEQLVGKLTAFVAGGPAIEDSHQGQVRRSSGSLAAFSSDPDLRQTIEKWIAGRKLAKLLDLWVRGLELDWSKLYGEPTPGRVSLPVYPFAKDRHWIDMTPAAAVKGTPSAVLHPLLHGNTSDLNEQRYSSTFAEPTVLSAAALLEMARAAVEHAAPERPASALLELRETVWRPVTVRENDRIHVALFMDNDRIGFEIYGDDEIIHCQGHAVWNREPAPSGIAVGNDSLTRLRLPKAVEDSAAEYVLHPSLVDDALQACSKLSGSGCAVALDSLRIVAPCNKELVAWVRRAVDGHKLDVELCDEQGNVCAQLRGVSWQPETFGETEPMPSQAEPAIARAGTALPVVQDEIAIAARAARTKPSAVSLAAPAAVIAARQISAARPTVTLAHTNVPGSETATVRLEDLGDGAFTIRIDGRSGDTIVQLRRALDQVRQEMSAIVLTIAGIECLDDHNAAIEQRLYESLVSVPCPVIAVLRRDTIGAGFLAASLCDFLVCDEDARFGYVDVQRQIHPAAAEAMLFAARFGDPLAHDLLYVSTVATGGERRAKGWTCAIVPAAEIDATVNGLASTFAGKAPEALRLLKRHLTRNVSGLVKALTPVQVIPDASPSSHAIVSPSSGLRLDTPAENVLVITLRTGEEQVGLDELAADLRRVFAEIRRRATCKAVVLATDHSEFLPADIVLDVQRLVDESEIPVVAALEANARGNAWLTAQFCDASVYSRQGVYSSANVGQMAAAVFAYRFGNAVAGELLLTGSECSGSELQRRVGALIVAEHDQVLSTAVQLAASWAAMPRSILTAWKQHSAATIENRVRGLHVGWEQKDEALEPLIAAPTPIALQSRVVTAIAHPGGIVVVKMEDRDAKNMFSEALREGVAEAFAHIANAPAYKVVVLTGYDHYFASGGTKEGLLAIQAGKVKFTDSKIFQLPLDCRLPVIAAMQGHGIGAGWSLGMFADIVLLSEESRYVSPYMGYGFTPGAGATWSLANKMGEDLARESLLSAQTCTGAALKSRGLGLSVLPRADVQASAMALAKQIAQAPRSRLIQLKQQLTAHVHGPLEEAYRLELAMHDETFVGRSDTLSQIERNFHQEIVEIPPAEPRPQPESTTPGVDGDALPAVIATLRTLLANELLMSESDIDENAQFVDLGLDSISGVSWIRRINEKYQTSIEATKVYSYPTLMQLGRHVKTEADARGTLASSVAPLVVEEAPVAPSSTSAIAQAKTRTESRGLTSHRRRASRVVLESSPVPRAAAEPIAIIGMAGQFPQARNLDEFWRNIAEGRNCISEVPRDRWDVNAFYQPGDIVAGKTNSQWVGALDEYDVFDPLFFNISPTEAEFMDPQQRLFLQACWHSIENAGYDARLLSGTRTGVFVGCATSDYHQLSRAHQLTAQGFVGTATSILAARISYFMNLQGPCVSIDTACSSSLVAIAQACDSLNSRDTDLALAGGVYVMAGPEMHIRTAQAGMLSPEGKCYAFDQRANGFVPGEGVGVIVLKRLSDARRDRDIVLGVVEGWGVNQDGKTNGITAPNPESQTRLELDVYEKYRIDPSNIQLIEAHGTATKLGDPIEIEGLKASFGKYTRKASYCALGSVKSNIGHTLTAAGMAGTIKLLLALQHKQLPPTIHYERLNEHIDLTGSPFYVNTRLQDWPLGGASRRQAAISSFGFSGTNAHLVIAEYQTPAATGQPAARPTPNAATVVPLSARTPGQLRQKALDLLQSIRSGSVELDRVAYTLQVGRTAMDERVGFIVSSISQLASKLQAYVDGEHPIEDVHEGQVRRNREALSLFTIDTDLQETIDKWIANRKLSRLADLWVKGLDLDWSKLWGESTPQRVSLPVYPFAKEHYWIDTTSIKPAVATAVLHPLLHGNTSDLSEHRYSSTFTGEEPFLAGGNVLPAFACLEMARAAIEHALPATAVKCGWGQTPTTLKLELRDMVWGEAVVVGSNKPIHIALWQDGEAVDYEIYSEDAELEIVHCRGRAMLMDVPAPAKLDLRGRTRFRLPGGTDEFVLHPGVLDAVLQQEACVPFALDCLRILAPCAVEMLASVRPADGGDTLDIDLCDERGNVCIEMRGLSLGAACQPTNAVTLLARPEWEVSELAASVQNEYAEHHVILCELSAEIPDAHCLSLQAAPGSDLAQRYSEYAIASFERVQSILRSKPQRKVLMQIVTADEAFAGLSALLKTAALENPNFVGQLVRVPDAMTAEELSGVLRAEKDGGLDPLVRYELGLRNVQRWREVPDQDEPEVAFRDRSVYLITGGTGRLGTLFAREILRQTRTARVVLAGRSPSTDADLDARMSYRQVDLADLEQVRCLIASIIDEYGQLNGILHVAGMTADNLIPRKTVGEFSQVLMPKVTGTFHLDQATQDVELDFFVLFSSIAGATGNAGQADYAAANAFMDQFAAHRNGQVAAQQRRGRTRSVNWSLWQAGGMHVDAATLELVKQTAGIQSLQTPTGMRAFYRSLALPHDQLLVVEGTQPKLTTYLQQARLFEQPVVTHATRITAAPAVTLDELQQQIQHTLGGILKIEASKIDLDQPFGEFGLDSFLGAELVVAINRAYGTELSHLRVFDYPTVRELSLALQQELERRPATTALSVDGVRPQPHLTMPVLRKKARAVRKSAGRRARSDERIAIIGMSGRYPKANDLDQYWENLALGRNCVTEVPASRWDAKRYYDPDRAKPGKTNSRWLGAVDDVDCFDPLFFRISPQEAEYMDPQHRLFLQESYRAFEDAGYCPTTLSNRKCGVYLGISTNDYLTLLSRHGVLSAPVTSNSYAIAAARIAYYLNLKGPAISVDTACSASLVGIHLASQALLNGEIDMALAGGVTLWLTPESYVAMSQAGMFSSTGQCRTFDDSADGIVNGDGIGAVVLKRLSDAEADGDFIHGVIVGSGINQDGKTSGITAPSVQSQIELERSVYARHEIDPETISYVEAHGTGTRLGDPIELEALSTVFKEKTSQRNFCALGAVKSNIGHTTAAAGIAGLHKVLLSMRHRTLVPTLNVTRENSRFDFADSPFYISRETTPWVVAPGTLRRAAVSSFGFSGTNAHVVLDEYPMPESSPAQPSGDVIVPLSARTPEQLRQRSRDLLAFFRAAEQPVDLASVAYTLQVGREAMEERLGFVVSSVEQLIGKLSAWLDGEKNVERVHYGRVEPGRDEDMQDAIEKWVVSRRLTKLLDLWVRGLSFDWNRLYDGEKPRRISLPGYPFAKQRCWIPEAAPVHVPEPLEMDVDMNAIEDILGRLDDDLIETTHAVEALKMLV